MCQPCCDGVKEDDLVQRRTGGRPKGMGGPPPLYHEQCRLHAEFGKQESQLHTRDSHEHQKVESEHQKVESGQAKSSACSLRNLTNNCKPSNRTCTGSVCAVV